MHGAWCMLHAGAAPAARRGGGRRRHWLAVCGWPPVAIPSESSVFELDIITPSSTLSIKKSISERGYAHAILCATNILRLKSIWPQHCVTWSTLGRKKGVFVYLNC